MSGKSFAPNEIDIHIGHIISTLRHKHGLSQKDLGKALGVTFQQIQKYEMGSSRVSAASLYIILKTLEEPFSAVFAELGNAELYDAPMRRAVEMFCKLSLYDKKIVCDLIDRLSMSNQCVSRIRRKPIKRSLIKK